MPNLRSERVLIHLLAESRFGVQSLWSEFTSGQMTEWKIWVGLFAVLLVLHFPLLNLPYFWDEAGYYVPAAWDMFLTGDLIPHSTLTNAHPPLPALYLAACWKIVSYSPTVSRVAMLFVSAWSLLAVFRLSRAASNPRVALATTLCTMLYPVWFVQSSLTHADVLATAFTLWGVAFYFEGRYVRAGIIFALAALSKETAVIAPVTLAGWELLQILGERSAGEKPFPYAAGRVKRAIVLSLLPGVPLALWYAYHFLKTGYIFGNPEFFRYNVSSTISLDRFGLGLLQRLWHILGHMGMYVLTLFATLALLFKARTLDRKHGPAASGGAMAPSFTRVLVLLVAAYVVGFSLLGGALLTRYLLSAYPLFILLAIATLWRNFPRWHIAVLLVCLAFAASLVTSPPYSFAFEDNLTYRDYVRLHQAAADYITRNYPHGRVLTAWTASDELRRPFLGYVKVGMLVWQVDDFSREVLTQSRPQDRSCTLALLFSRKSEATGRTLPRFQWWERVNRKYFDYQKDLSPTEAAALLNGKIVWEYREGGLQADLIELHPSAMATLPCITPARG